MASYLKIEIDTKDAIQKIQKEFSVLPDVMQAASVSAINKTLRHIKNEAVKIPPRVYTAKASILKKRAKLSKATNKNLHAKLEIKDRNGIGLINFAPRPSSVLSWKGIAPKNRKKFVTNQIRRNGKRRVFNDHGSPFVAEVDNGKHIFYRDRQDKLKRLFGPSLVFALFGADKELEQKADDYFPRALEEELEKVLYAK